MILHLTIVQCFNQINMSSGKHTLFSNKYSSDEDDTFSLLANYHHQ